jgi:endonuclease III
MASNKKLDEQESPSSIINVTDSKPASKLTTRSRKRHIYTADELELNITSGDDDLFRWFLLSYLFGKPIQSSVALQTWRILIAHRLDTPWAIVQVSRRRLVRYLDEGNYTRYDESTARGLQNCMERPIRDYEGSLLLMIESSESEDELSKRLQTLYGVGPKTAEIFMRETEEFFARRVE